MKRALELSNIWCHAAIRTLNDWNLPNARPRIIFLYIFEKLKTFFASGNNNEFPTRFLALSVIGLN